MLNSTKHKPKNKLTTTVIASATLMVSLFSYGGLSEDIQEWNLLVKLMAIKDPFDRWRAFTKEISKVWPRGVSAVDAIREQRDREWNQ